MSSAVYVLNLQAMPATHWAVGESGTAVTCSIQGFLITTSRFAFAFNYASLGIISCKGDYYNFVMILVLTWCGFFAHHCPSTAILSRRCSCKE